MLPLRADHKKKLLTGEKCGEINFFFDEAETRNIFDEIKILKRTMRLKNSN